jgi:hypothetical protein
MCIILLLYLSNKILGSHVTKKSKNITNFKNSIMKVRSIFFIFFFSFFTILVLYSCTDDFDSNTDLNGSVNDIGEMLKSEDIVQRFSINVDSFVFKSKNNTWVTTRPNSFIYEDNGAQCTGVIDIEYTELFTKSEILRYGIPTLTYDNKILESDGEFLITASQAGRKVKLAPQKTILLSVKNEKPNNQMKLFVEAENLWIPAGDASGSIFIVNTSNDVFTNIGYGFLLNSFRWVNIDYFSKFDKPLTKVSVALPNGYKDSNTRLFAVFSDLKIVLPISCNTFSAMFPLDQKVNFVVISAESKDEFRFQIRNEKVIDKLKVPLYPRRTSEDDILKRLKALD